MNKVVFEQEVDQYRFQWVSEYRAQVSDTINLLLDHGDYEKAIEVADYYGVRALVCGIIKYKLKSRKV